MVSSRFGVLFPVVVSEIMKLYTYLAIVIFFVLQIKHSGNKSNHFLNK